MTTSLRARYMDNGDSFSFADYYGALIEHIGEETLRRLLPMQYTPTEWRLLIAADRALNNVPLRRWDAMHDAVRMSVRFNDELVAITGSRGWSLSDSVCVLKETARRYAATEVPN